MNKLFYIGMAMAIPPYGWIFEPLGTTVQFLGVAVQALGFGLMVVTLHKKG